MSMRDRLMAVPSIQGMHEGYTLWQGVTSLEDGGALVARWLRGDLAYLPWDSNKPADETVEAEGFAEAMARLNEQGVMTTASQPGGITQPQVIARREYVSMVAPTYLVTLIQKAAEAEGMRTESTPQKRPWKKDSTPVTWAKSGRATARLRDSTENVAAFVSLGAPAIGAGIKDGSLFPITIYDPVKARRGEVQSTLDLLTEIASAYDVETDSLEGDPAGS